MSLVNMDIYTKGSTMFLKMKEISEDSESILCLQLRMEFGSDTGFYAAVCD